MRPLPAALTLACLAAQAWFGWRSARAYHGLPRLSLDPPRRPAPGHPPSVSIIVPARNEAATLPLLLPSLLAQEYPHVELIVVDDDSTDGTATVARALGARVITAGPLPPGWAGKPHACATGAAAVQGEWLLFTDADTWHAPGSLRAALAHAVANNLEALSLFPAQQCVTPWEQMLLPYAYQHFIAGVNPTAVNDPAQPDLLLNGQYLLIRRDAYHRAGSHAAVRDSVIEDMAFAAVLKRRRPLSDHPGRTARQRPHVHRPPRHHRRLRQELTPLRRPRSAPRRPRDRLRPALRPAGLPSPPRPAPLAPILRITANPRPRPTTHRPPLPNHQPRPHPRPLPRCAGEGSHSQALSHDLPLPS